LQFEGVKESKNTLKYARDLIRNHQLNYMSWNLTTPYPGSPLWETCKKYKLIKEEYLGHWEVWNPGWNMLMQLPGMTQKDCMKVKRAGAWLQVETVLRNLKSVNVSDIPLLFAKALRMVQFWRTETRG
jgi:hypothetical protein